MRDVVFWGFGNPPILPRTSQCQSGYCSTNDGREGQRNKVVDPDHIPPPGDGKAAAHQGQSRSALPFAGCF
jgi:hypothetical protein